MSAQQQRAARLSAAEALQRMRDGRLTSVALVEDCLAVVAEREPVVCAFAQLDAPALRLEAQRADARGAADPGRYPLNGLPVAVKDIFDTQDLPTECGTPLRAGRRPAQDAAVVAALRRKGAIVMGKTVTTEFAIAAGGRTTNPRDPSRTPGGSSSGSAAAVAAGMTPLAIGSQTGGSIVRPAAFCGCVGYKPSLGRIPNTGMLPVAPSLDQVGVLARSVDDAALLAQHLLGATADPGATGSQSREALHPTVLPASPPRLAFVRTHLWDQVDPLARERLEQYVRSLPVPVDEIELPANFEQAVPIYLALSGPEMAHELAADWASNAAAMSAQLRAVLEAGRRVPAVDYLAARRSMGALRADLHRSLSGYDGAITPAVLGPAPRLVDGTGSPLCCLIWSLCGAPALSLPLLEIDGLPLGVQLVGACGEDRRLLGAARWLEHAGTPH